MLKSKNIIKSKPSLEESIEKKINGMNRTRNNRINASKRLYGYQDHWNVIFLIMNVLAIILLVLDINGVGISGLTIISSVFTLYALILQYYINSLNYSERALRFHFQELQIEEYLLELKVLLRKVRNEKGRECENDKEFSNIIEKYIIEIRGTENHSPYDDMKRDYESHYEKKNCIKKPKDLSIDKLIIIINYIILLFLFVYLIIRNS